jgi:hypothetical protein
MWPTGWKTPRTKSSPGSWTARGGRRTSITTSAVRRAGSRLPATTTARTRTPAAIRSLTSTASPATRHAGCVAVSSRLVTRRFSKIWCKNFPCLPPRLHLQITPQGYPLPMHKSPGQRGSPTLYSFTPPFALATIPFAPLLPIPTPYLFPLPDTTSPHHLTLPHLTPRQNLAPCQTRGPLFLDPVQLWVPSHLTPSHFFPLPNIPTSTLSLHNH